MHLSIRAFDIAVVAAYLAGMIGLGIYCARRSRTAQNYFVGRRSFPGWAVALSMLATIVSSTTFLALPAAAYVLDWRQLTVNLAMPFVAILAALVFIPFFRRAGLTSAFEYLHDRFGHGARLYAAISFIILQQVRLGIILFLVSLPVQFLTGAPITLVIVGCGVFVALYSLLGGMETVFWAGVVQALIMLAGGILCLWFVLNSLPGGFSQVVEVGMASNKFSLGSLDWNLHERTFYTVAILGVVNWITIFAGEQTMVQRYVSAGSLREARKATLLFSALAVPMWTMFFLIGTSLFVYFQIWPAAEVAQLQPDQVLPYFVLKHIPAGGAGLVIAAVLSAAMSSLDSGVNSVSTVVVVDLLKGYFAPSRSDRFYLQAARIISGAAIVLMTVVAVVFSRIEKESMNDVSLTVASIFGGCIMGIYLVGFFVARVDGWSVNVALAAAVALNAYLLLGTMGALPPAWTLPVHSYWATVLVNIVFILLACGLGFLRRGTSRDLAGLTIWTMSPQAETAPVGAPPERVETKL